MGEAAKTPTDFVEPTQLPADPGQAAKWQDANRTWWEGHPMRYDWKAPVGKDEFSKEFFEEIDRRFLATSREFLPFKSVPFDALIDFAGLKDKDVLEIGVGNGSHASLLARHARSFTGIDLTDYAVRSTTARFAHFGLRGNILRMDAEQMSFPDASFDFVWSWGVIHHSSNTRRILEQIHRVLRPGGKATIMVYNRSFYTYWVCAFLLFGVLRGQLLKTRSINQILQSHTDGAIARYYRKSDWRALVGDLFTVDRFRVYGNKPEFWPLPGGKIKSALTRATPSFLSRLFLNRMGQGSFLVAEMTRRG